MYFLKYLVSAILATTPVESEGWYDVERVEKNEDASLVDDSSIWVLFAKDLLSEEFQVRFPHAPSYRYTASGGFEVGAMHNGESWQVAVQELKGEAQLAPLSYQLEGKWIREEFVQTATHLYHLKTVSLSADSNVADEFISSFSIGKIR
ncbi:MAG: hypothetical protein COT85_00070 [Chlamydiae bacterium CG10_big_fil_rev_8_21_14_0_10_42_34]|nr:MAG: hypothetical protein COT85_00070 [Chlamydiae bacterium CG10_big_fil_rev_8_21_14_0_10_42_34]